jgi:hypothetical protein
LCKVRATDPYELLAQGHRAVFRADILLEERQIELAAQAPLQDVLGLVPLDLEPDHRVQALEAGEPRGEVATEEGERTPSARRPTSTHTPRR